MGWASNPAAWAVVALGALAGVGCSDRSPAGSGARVRVPDAAAAERLVRDYYAAFNARDGVRICSMFVPELRTKMDRVFPGRHLRCPKLVSGYIGYGEESDTPTFQTATIRSVRSRVAGGQAAVAVRARLSYEGVDPERRTHDVRDVIYLRPQRDRWRIVKPGAIYYSALGAFQVPSSVLDPPLDDEDASRLAREEPAGFSCGTRQAKRLPDAAGDVEPDESAARPAGDIAAAVDARGVSVTADAEGNVCFAVDFASRPRPGTAVSLYYEQDAVQGDGFWPGRPEIRIGHRGRLHVTYAEGRARAGWRDGILLLRIERNKTLDGRRPLRLSATVRSQQRDEPLVHRPVSGVDWIPGDASQ